MKAFSDAFLLRNQVALRDYGRRWVEDPLGQWSRQWEYPFVFDRIRQLGSDQSLRILDAGSGATFFPYFLSIQNPAIRVSCCDYDDSLSSIYDQLNRNEECAADFSIADLRTLPFEDHSFDVVYCISVLEHTNAYDAIVGEFYRVLRPGGKLVITFDISIDGKHDIPAVQAVDLLRSLVEFDGAVPNQHCPPILKELEQQELVATTSFIESAPHLLPWKKPGPLDHVKSYLKSGHSKTWPNLTFYCLDIDKAEQ